MIRQTLIACVFALTLSACSGITIKSAPLQAPAVCAKYPFPALEARPPIPPLDRYACKVTPTPSFCGDPRARIKALVDDDNYIRQFYADQIKAYEGN